MVDSLKQNKIIKGVDWAFSKLVDLSGASGILIMILLSIFISVYMCSRHVAALNIPGFYDFARYVLIIFPFCTMAYSMRDDKHIKIDVIINMMSEKGKVLLRIIYSVTACGFSIVLTNAMFSWCKQLFARGTGTMAIVVIPQWILVAIMTIGVALLALVLVRSVIIDVVQIFTDRTNRFRTKDFVVIGIMAAMVVVALLMFNLNQTYMYIATLLVCVVFLFCGMPVFLGLLCMGVIGLYFAIGTRGFLQLPITVFGQMNKFELTCLPIFIFAGCVMARGNLIDDLFNFVEAWIGGSIASVMIVSVIVGALLSSLTGSSTAATAMLASAALPQLQKRGFKPSIGAGIVAACGTGSLIPPSNGYVLYCVLTDNSIGDMFMGAYFPALLLFGIFVVMIIARTIIKPESLFVDGKVHRRAKEDAPSFKQKLLLTWKAVPVLLGPILMFVLLFTGFFTPTEGAAFLLLYAIAITLFVKRTVTLKGLMDACVEGAHTSSTMLSITATAFIFATVISQLGIANTLLALSEKVGVTYWGVYAILFVILLVLGMVMPTVAAKVITIPIFYPIAIAAGINPLVLGAFYQIMCELATFSPPFGMSLFVLKGVTNISFKDTMIGCIPYAICYLVALVLIALFPTIVTILPSLMG